MRTAFGFLAIRTFLLLLPAVLGLSIAYPASAQVPADLRTYEQVQPSEPLPIDGVWRLQELNRQVLIENGHVIALEEWVHMFFWNVERGMVTSTDLRQTGPSSFTAYDALLKRSMEWTLREDGSILASGGPGLFDPKFSLSPIELAYPAAFEEARQAVGMVPPAENPPMLPGARPLPGPPADIAPALDRPAPLELDIALTSAIENGRGKCLDLDSGDAVKQGGKIQVWTCLGGANQKFLFLRDDGLIVTASGMCLEAQGAADGSSVRTFGCDSDNVGQKWAVVKMPLGGSMIQHVASNKCLDADATGADQNGGVVQLWECSLTDNQKWAVE